MLRKAMVEQQLDILLQSTERLKSSIVIPQEPGEKGTDYNVIVSQLQKIESRDIMQTYFGKIKLP